ncbi:MAG: M20/M25/M40 family metallo-hydrolase [Myxococcota bacterium]|nr:M20/M25/M40 family metallo-hydrolase [Myxococcota bacterium]
MSMLPARSGSALFRLRLLAPLLLFLPLLSGCRHAPEPVAPLPQLPAGIESERIRADVAWLAADEQGGRGIGTPGLAQAADWLAARFAEAGFEGGAPEGGFLQRFQVPVSIQVEQATLEIPNATSGTRAGERGVDFEALLASTSGTLPEEVVFAGFGISDEETGWDDYAGLDVSGKTVLVLDGRPGESGDDPLGGGRGAAFARPAYKLLNARRNGAAALLIAPALADVPGFPGIGGHGGANPSIRDAGLLAISLSRPFAADLLAAAGEDLGALQRRADEEREAGGKPLDVRLVGAVEIERRDGEVANVIGILRGSDPLLAEQAVVIGAHYDHLGTGAFGSLSPSRLGEIHSGADDNASGTAALVALARAFGQGERPRRTLILIGFTAEEAGLLGSAHYVTTPSVPIEDTVAMVNLDMVGRLREDRLVAFGSESGSGLRELVDAAAEGTGLRIEHQVGAQGPSDQTSFASQRVPVLFFFTGTHPQYHTPDDQVELVEAEGIARVASLTLSVARGLLEDEERAEFLGNVAGHGSGALPAGGGGYGPSLGTIPAFGGEPVEGVRLSGVRPGSPAEAAGLQGGDVIVRFAGSSVRNLEEFAALLFSQVPGREVEIEVLRDGERISTRATLGQRR